LIGFSLEFGNQTAAAVYCAASSNCYVQNCVITLNTGPGGAGIIYQGTIENCFIAGNGNVGNSGYVVENAVLNNCAIVSNNIPSLNSYCVMTNCIDYYNYYNGNLDNGSPRGAAYCCTTPLPSGPGNFTNAPQLFVGGVHLAYGSPCIGAGINPVTGTDIFGQPWANPPSIGCAEYNPAPLTGQPSINLIASPVGFSAYAPATGSPPLSLFWIKDGFPLQDGELFTGTQSTNLSAATVDISEQGDYQLVASNAFGVVTSAVTTLSIHCVNVGGTNPVPPYLTWNTAATNIQDAITAGGVGDIVLVTNGIYALGAQSEDGLGSNRVTLDRAIRVQSVNGPFVTTILGGGESNGSMAICCAWLTNNSILIGFTLAQGATVTSGSHTGPEAGGGVWCATPSNCFVDNCVMVSNTAAGAGAAAYQGILRNCLLGNNGQSQGTAMFGTLYNCTVVSNSSSGVNNEAITNCIVYYNSGENEFSSAAAYCCITPALTGSGNFTNAPVLAADGVHLSLNSPCIGAGTNITVGTDIFGKSWLNPPSVGCAEFYVLAPTLGQPQITLTSSGFTIWVAILLGQGPFTYEWFETGAPVHGANFGGTQSSNLVVTGVNLAEAGTYQVVVSNAAGATTSAVVQLNIHAVDLASTNPTPPYATWATAATNIQDAIATSSPGDIVLVTNGIYDFGGEAIGGLTNRVVLERAVLVISANGFKSTVIAGAWDPTSTNGPAAVRCAWLTNGAILSGFTLENGATWNTGDDDALQSGGGVWCESTNALVSNCLLTNNFAAYYGGGIVFGTLANSLVVGNEASSGGASYNANLNNCTVMNNFATNYLTGTGGGTDGGIVRNSIVIGNYLGYPYDIFFFNDYATFGVNYAYCCTENLYGEIPSGPGNTPADPLLLDWHRISIYSPLRGAGSALYASGTDLDGEPWNNPPSIGCDEVVPADRTGPLTLSFQAFDTNVLVSSSAVQHYDSFFGIVTGLPSYLSWDFGDGSVNTNASDSVLHNWTNTGDYTVVFTAYNVDNPAGVSASQVIHVLPINPPQFQSLSIVSNMIEFQFSMQVGGNYYVQYATNLAPPVTWRNLQSDYDSFGGTFQVQDPATNAARFYRVVVQ
jgi:hypothetical protein